MCRFNPIPRGGGGGRSGRVRKLVYVAFIRTPNFIGVHMNLNMSTLTRTLIFSLWFLNRFFLVLMLYCLKTYCYIYDLYLFVLGRDRFFTVYICFKESLFFNFSYKLLLNIICFYYKIMKKPHMRTITDSSGRDCVLIKARLFKGN